MVQVYAVRLDKTLGKSEYDILMSHVLAEKQERISRFYRFEDAQRTLIGDILTRYLICKRLNISNNMLEFGLTEYGKPYLCGRKEIHFNISHSGEWVVGCIDNLPVGIDVEKIEPIDISIAGRFFSREEFEGLKAKNLTLRKEYFYELWTLKESYIKAVGKGLSIPLDSFTIRIEKDNITAYAAGKPERYYLRQYYLDENYKMAVCAKSNYFESNVEICKINEIYEKFLTVL